MEKRVIVAFVISMLILVGWSALSSKMYPIKNKQVASETKSVGHAEQPDQIVAIKQVTPPAVAAKTEKLIKLPQGLFDISFAESSASVDNVVYHKYQDRVFLLKNGLGFLAGSMNFSKDSISSDSISFVASDPNLKFKKVFSIDNSNYIIGLRITIKNMSNQTQAVNIPLVLGVLDSTLDGVNAQYHEVMVAEKEKTIRPNKHKTAEFTDVKFIAMRDRYMCAIIEAVPNTTLRGFINRIDAHQSEVGVMLQADKLFPGEQIERSYKIYLGPQDLRVLTQANPEWSAVVYYGTFDFIAHVLLQAMEFLYKAVHNWGWVIVLLGLLIYVVLFPLTMKQMRSMKEMQKLQPKIEALRASLKDNPQKLNKEIMELYKTHKVNPFSGCLPMILQIPVFFALYQVLTRSIALKGASFLWIKDLSEPDRLFTLTTALPIIGKDINILPILMAIGMYIQQKISTVAASAEAAQQQKIMAIMLPILFGFMFYRMPAGLVLYWFVNSTLMLLYQIRISRSK